MKIARRSNDNMTLVSETSHKQNHGGSHKAALNENLPTLCNDSSFAVQFSNSGSKTRIVLLFTIKIDLVTVFDAILTSRQTREQLQCLYEKLMLNNFRRTAVLTKI